jgi:hypothetical protein
MSTEKEPKTSLLWTDRGMRPASQTEVHASKEVYKNGNGQSAEATESLEQSTPQELGQAALAEEISIQPVN